MRPFDQDVINDINRTIYDDLGTVGKLPMCPPVARHLTNEKKVQEFQPGKGLVTKWMRTGQQHWLDAAAYARAAGSRLGWKPKRAEDHSTPG